MKKKTFHIHLVEYKLFPSDVNLLYPFIIPLYLLYHIAGQYIE